MTASGPTRKTRLAVWDRDEGTCQWCSRVCAEGMGDLQHRRARGSGGSSAADTNLPGNLVLMHRECHRYVESHPEEASFRGFNIRQGVIAARVPFQDGRGIWWVIGDDKSKTDISEGLAHEYLALYGVTIGTVN